MRWTRDKVRARRLLRSSRPQEICQPLQQGFFCVRTCPVAASRKYFSAIHTSPHLNSPHTWSKNNIILHLLLMLCTAVKFCHQFHLCCWYRWQICLRCQRHRWQTMWLISGCRNLKVNLKAKIYIYVNSTIQRCHNKIFKIFLIKDFLICHRCQQHRWSTLSCEYLSEFSKKFETVLMGYSGAGGELILEKN